MKFFVSSTSLTDEVYPEHNEAIAGDSLFNISLNYKWRKLLAGLLEKAWRNDLSEMSLDNQDFLSALILDLYTLEVNANMLTKSLGIDLITNKSTSSTSYVAIAGSGFNHNFSKPNALIRVSDMHVSGTAGETVTIKLNVASLTPVNIQEAIVDGASIRTISCAHVYTAIPAGSRAIDLVWKVSGGSGAMSSATYLHYEIIEYD